MQMGYPDFLLTELQILSEFPCSSGPNSMAVSKTFRRVLILNSNKDEHMQKMR